MLWTNFCPSKKEKKLIEIVSYYHDTGEVGAYKWGVAARGLHCRHLSDFFCKFLCFFLYERRHSQFYTKNLTDISMVMQRWAVKNQKRWKFNQPCSWRMWGTWGLWCKGWASLQNQGVSGSQKSPEYKIHIYEMNFKHQFFNWLSPLSLLDPPTMLAMSTQGPMRLLK